MDPTPPSRYRVAPLLVARLVGSYLVALALLIAVVTAAVAVLDLPGDLIVAFLVLGVLGLFGGAWWLRERVVVVRLDDDGYRVRLVRGAGVRAGRWDDVAEAAVVEPAGLRCLELRRRDGATTTIPYGAVTDPLALTDDVTARLRAAHRR